MKHRLCDRCGKWIKDDDKRVKIVISMPGTKGAHGKDLCPECYEKFVKFMEEGEHGN